VFSELDLPRPLEPETVEAVLLRLAADRAAPVLVFEARAATGGTRHLIAAPAEHVRWAQRTLRDLIPGLEIDGVGSADRGLPVQRAVRLRLRPPSLALATERPELISAALLSSLDARLSAEETLVVQLVLGPRRGPRHLPRDLADPTQPWWQLLSQGAITATKSLQKQIDARGGQHGFAATLRIGACTANRDRARQLIIGVLGALSTAQSRGTYLDLRPENPRRVNTAARPWRWPLRRLAVSEIVGLLAWPLGDGDLPGLPPIHPKRLRVPPSVTSTERVFAVSSSAGEPRPVGIKAADSASGLLAIGPTGSAKSTVFQHLVRASAESGQAILVIDPKRQLIDDIVERAIPEHRVNDVAIIDAAQHNPVGFNPLDLGDRDPNVVADGITAALAHVFRDGWGLRTEDIVSSGLTSLLIAARARQRREGSDADPYTLLDLPRLYTDSTFRRSVIGHSADDPGLASFWAWFDNLNPGAQAQALAAPTNKLRRYMTRPALRAILGQAKPRLRLRDLFRDHRIVLVCLNEGLIGPIAAQLLGALIVAESWSATLERASERNPAANVASLFVDEAQQYLAIPTSIEDAFAQSRSLGVAWHIAHQYRRQMPTELLHGLDSNAKTKIVWRLLDPDDARDFAKQAPSLEPIDFQSLGRFEAYANINTDGTPSGWCHVRTLPPPEPTGLADRIREASRRNFAPSRPTTSRPKSPAAPTDGPVGRKRRMP
jgi:hypothetical protein